MSEKLEMQSSNIIQENIDYIASRFPNVLKEIKENGKIVKKIDFDILKEELSTVLIDDKQERYQMTWPDKKKSIHLANSRTNATLRPVKEKSVDFDNTQNLYIEGDNLEVLKILRETYLGKVKMIYIDPPYNTGNDFVYKDDFKQSTEDYLEQSGQYDEQGNRLFTNGESNGRFHTDWLNMMYPRLKVARDLLADDGVIFISIDDNELDNLKKICDELFGSKNFISNFIWEKTQHFGRQTKNVYGNADYILCYAKKLFDNTLNEYLVEFINNNLTDAPLYNASNNVKKLTFPKGTVKFNLPDGKYTNSLDEKYKLKMPVIVKNGYNANDLLLEFKSRWADSTILEEVKKGTTFWVKTQSFAIRAIYSQDKTSNVSPRQIIFTNSSNPMKTTSRFNQKIGTSENASLEVSKLLSSDAFSYPKPVSLIKYLISLLYNKNTFTFDENPIVLDFFSGSGTTAQAVFEYNLESKNNFKFICIQLPELVDQVNFESICAIGEERIRRAGNKIKEEAGMLANEFDLGFRVLKLDSSNMTDVYYNPNLITKDLLSATVDNIKGDRNHLDLLFQVMLELGVELSSKIEEKEFSGKQYFIVNENDIVACFDNDITEDLIKELAYVNPLYAVFRDSSFSDDSVNINCEQIFKSISPTTNIKVL